MDKFSEFCDHVTAQIRFMPDHASISNELTAHLEDHRDALISQGIPAEQAEEEAVSAMGDPIELGRALSKLHSPLLGWVQLLVRLALWVIGIYGIISLGGYLWSYDNIYFYTPDLSDLAIPSTVYEGNELATLSCDQTVKAGAYTFRVHNVSIYEDTEPNTYVAAFSIHANWYNPWLLVENSILSNLYAADQADDSYAILDMRQTKYNFCSARYIVYVSVPADAAELTITCDHIQQGDDAYAIDYPFVLTIPLTGGEPHG